MLTLTMSPIPSLISGGGEQPYFSRMLTTAGSAIIIFDADDIILAEITPGLDLDQFELDLAGIFQAMLRPDRNVARFIFMHDLGLVVDGHARGAAHHDPVFGAMVMHLQR